MPKDMNVILFCGDVPLHLWSSHWFKQATLPRGGATNCFWPSWLRLGVQLSVYAGPRLIYFYGCKI